MKLCKLIRYDFKNGTLNNARIYLLAFIMFFVFIGKLYFDITRKTEVNIIGKTTIINLLFGIFQGKEPFNPKFGEAFVFPVVWILFFALSIYVTLDYPFRDLKTNGIQVMTRIHNRKKWWLSKCIWVMGSTLLYYALFYLSIILFCLLFKVDISFEYSEYVNFNSFYIQMERCTVEQIVFMVIVMPIMTSLALDMLQLSMEFFIPRVYCFLLILAILFASTYFKISLAIGNFAMIKRSELCIENGMQFKYGILIDLLIISISMICGLIKINDFNILGNDN